MRLATAVIAMCTLACGRGPAADPPTPASGYEIDARGKPALTDGSWTLRADGQSIGSIIGAVRCGDVLALADAQGRVRRLDLATGRTLNSILDGTLAMAVGADCDAGQILAIGPPPYGKGRGRLLLVIADFGSGAVARTVPVSATLMPGQDLLVENGQVFVGGLWMPTVAVGYEHPPAPRFFSDKKMGLAIVLADGSAEPMSEPFEMSCPGAGACVGGSLAHSSAAHPTPWLVTQPTVPAVGLYGADRQFARSLDISSPMLLRDGSTLEAMDAAERMRWSSRNSQVRSAWSFEGGVVAAVHYLVRLPQGWQFGQVVQMDHWMNLVSLDGRKLVSDIRLPGVPVGRDATHLYTIDYGPEGRQGAHDSVTVRRVPVRTGSAAFSR